MGAASTRRRARDHPLPLRLEEPSGLGSGAIFGRSPAGDSGLDSTSLCRVNARPGKAVAIKLAPPIISQCGNWIDESNPLISPSALVPFLVPTARPSAARGFMEIGGGHLEDVVERTVRTIGTDVSRSRSPQTRGGDPDRGTDSIAARSARSPGTRTAEAARSACADGGRDRAVGSTVHRACCASRYLL
jgi:hypothetical protein